MDIPILYKCKHKAFDIDACLYKIHDDSIKLRHFLSIDNEDEIEAILLDYEGHSEFYLLLR